MANKHRRGAHRPEPVQLALVQSPGRLLEGLDDKRRRQLRNLMAELLLEAARHGSPEGAGDE